VSLYRRPLCVQDAVHAGVTQRACGIGMVIDLVVAQNAIELGAQAFNGAAALLVEEMRSKFNGIAMELFKGVGQQHAFAFCVDQGALHTAAIPRGANFNTEVGRIDVHVRGHAHGLALDHHGEGQETAFLVQIQATRNFIGHFFWRGNEGVPMAPKLAILHGFKQIVMVRSVQWHQLSMFALEVNRLRESVLRRTHHLSFDEPLPEASFGSSDFEAA